MEEKLIHNEEVTFKKFSHNVEKLKDQLYENAK